MNEDQVGHTDTGEAEEDSPPPRSREQMLTLTVGGLVVLYAMWTVSTSSVPPPPPPPPSGQVVGLSPEMIPLVSGDEPVADIFTKAGCAVCHTIPGVPGAKGQVGPLLVLGSTGEQRLADPSNRGSAKTVREYIVESIVEPGVYIVPGYPERTMPTWYGVKLSGLALAKIAGYLESQQEIASPPQ